MWVYPVSVNKRPKVGPARGNFSAFMETTLKPVCCLLLEIGSVLALGRGLLVGSMSLLIGVELEGTRDEGSGEAVDIDVTRGVADLDMAKLWIGWRALSAEEAVGWRSREEVVETIREGRLERDWRGLRCVDAVGIMVEAR